MCLFKTFLYALLALISALELTAAPLWDAVTPEDTLYATTRCIEEWSPKAKDPAQAVQHWRQWKLHPADDEATQCFTKCLLETIGIFDRGSKRFKGVRIMQQWETFAVAADMMDLREKVQDFQGDLDMGLPLDSISCESIFKAYANKVGRHSDTARKIFFIDETTAKKFYDAKECSGDTVKKNGQSYFEFCENKFYPAGSAHHKDLCKVRKYEVLEGDTFKDHINCIFKGLRYLKKNDINSAEIARDFKLVGKDHKKLYNALVQCATDQQEDMDPSLEALYYYKCMLSDSTVAEDFKEAFNYREIRSQDYDYLLKGDQKYDKSAIDAKVAEADKKQCP